MHESVRTHAGLLALSVLVATSVTVAGVSPALEPAQTTDGETFVVESTTDGASFNYTFTVDGDVQRTSTSGATAEDGDRIIENDDGTVTVHGVAGNHWADAYEVDGTIVAFEKTGGQSTFRLEHDGRDVTQRLTGTAGVPTERGVLATLSYQVPVDHIDSAL